MTIPVIRCCDVSVDDFAADPLALSHRERDLVEDLGQVSADGALDVDRGEDHVKVSAVDPFTHGSECVLSTHTQVGVPKHPADLERNRRLHLAPREFKALHQTVAGLEGVGKETEKIDELAFEPAHAAGLLVVHPPGGQHVAKERAHESTPDREQRRAEQQRYEEQHERHREPDHVEFADPQRKTRPLQEKRRLLRTLELGKEGAQYRQATVGTLPQFGDPCHSRLRAECNPAGKRPGGRP